MKVFRQYPSLTRRVTIGFETASRYSLSSRLEVVQFLMLRCCLSRHQRCAHRVADLLAKKNEMHLVGLSP